MQLSIPLLMNEWSETQTGSGAFSYSSTGETATVSAADGDRAFLYWPMVAFPGDTFRMSIMARNISGTAGALVVDMPNGTQKDRINIDSPEWKLYTLDYSMPIKGDTNAGLLVSEVAVGVGVGTAGAGEVEFGRPQVDLLRGQGTQRLIATGVMMVDQSNAVSWLSSFSLFGFESNPVFNSGDITIKLSTDLDTNRGTNQIRHRAMPSITTTQDGWDNAAGPIHFGAKGVSDADGSFTITGYDSSGAKVTDFNFKSNRYCLIQVFAQ